ncbi:hypothetical protein PHLGIDRAFT_185074 [Phlebiopsis gigantea 11061_1 CR5-6]|uniref:DUF6534 domain-containing protein n=1 Tax=Phlebiopsis gigantea (strain 11061_1 CR5-6) TaxID=745531 RepID=A0A0C3SCG0_PHLG1|nr:hypothetical protein PHLGIDRAFT_185074 [Phlebiopsis gigantea 11061_1 CR5-6]
MMSASLDLKSALAASEMTSLANAMLPMLKYSVLAIWAFNTMQTSFDIYFVYRNTLRNWEGTSESVATISWPEGGVILTTTFSNLVIQVWYTYRVRMLSNNRSLVAILGVFVFVTSALGVYMLEHTSSSSVHFNPLLYTAKSLDIVANLSVSATVCFYLARSRRHALARTRCILKLFAMYAAHTGLYGILIPLLAIVLRAMHPNIPLYFAVLLPYSTLYSNSLLGSLNTQDWFCNDSGVITVPLDQLQWTDPGFAPDGKSLGSKAVLNEKLITEIPATMSA